MSEKNRPKESVNFAKQTLAIYWYHIKQKPGYFIVAVICNPLSSLLLATGAPYFLSQAIASLTTGGETITRNIVLASVAGVAGTILNYIGFKSIIIHESYMYNALVNHAASSLMHKDAAFFSNQKIGALTGKYIEFINSYIKIQDVIILKTFSFAIATIAGVVLIARSSVLLALIMLFFTVFILVEIRITMKIRTPFRKKRRETRAEIMGEVADALTNSMVVKTFAKESRELTHIKKRSLVHQELYRKDMGILTTEGSLRNLTTIVFQVLTIGLAVILLKNGRIELGAVIFALTYLQRVAAQIFTLGDIVNGYDNAFSEAAPITKMLITNNSIIDSPRAVKLSTSRGEILFSNVNYSYEDGNQAISKLNLAIKSGEKIGLVGHSGAGKTTVTKLLLRFDDLTSGTIHIDGQDISTVTQSSLREAIAYVPQEPMLFHRSLRENIGYANNSATHEMVESAAKKACAHDFIAELPNGYETIVGERGVKLSGGQRQRIAIARAILKDAPILLLDEATSALDSESEVLIQKALWKLMENRTAIVIAHRLSTIQKMDRILVLDKGKIVEEGSHKELLQKNGTYAKLWTHQSGGFIEE